MLMKILRRDGIALGYRDSGGELPAMVLVHGWGCDHTTLAPQQDFFRNSHRIIAVDLRGHGESDAPTDRYTMAAFADDLAWLCHRLSVPISVVIGHGMGGNIALELAARHPCTVEAVVLIDSFLFPSQTLLNSLQSLAEMLDRPSYAEAYREILSSLFISADDDRQKMNLLSYFPKAPQHVLRASFIHHVTEYDPVSAASGCHVPIAYLCATVPVADLFLLKGLTPQVVIGQTVASGHFSPLFVPNQINAMITDFLNRYVTR
jgi:pimeloyl-ACP methyl ester carboxylesterase